MKRSIYLVLFFFSISLFSANAEEIKIINLHNKSIDQILEEGIEEESVEEESVEEESVEDLEIIEELIDQEEEAANIESSDNVSINEVEENFNKWSEIDADDLIFILENINEINSPVLKNEFLSTINISNFESSNLDREDFEKLVVENLLRIGNREKTYKLIKSLQDTKNLDYINFYKKFELNYLLSTYRLNEACDFRNEIKNLNLTDKNNFFLKVDIFCLVLKEKFDEANLLNSLLDEETDKEDKYFQFLYNKIFAIDTSISDIQTSNINNQNIYLYSAMHRVANIPLKEAFLEIDTLNLSIPIILSSATDIELRIKAAHLAYFNHIIPVDSLAALYQAVDFSFEELNDQNNILPGLYNQIEIGMAYFYQLINIQLLPLTRLEAIIKFWEFAERHGLELIAYELAIKNLNTIEPSNEFSFYGADIVKAYTYNEDYLMAKKWLLFSEKLIDNEDFKYDLNSSRLLYNLFNIDESQNIIDVLYENLQYMNSNLIDQKSQDYAFKNQILYLIFSTLKENIQNPFKIEKKLEEKRLMPSIYILNRIRNAIEKDNQVDLLLSLLSSINGKKWNQIHPEHFRIILFSLKYYKNGNILNEILLEILKESKII